MKKLFVCLLLSALLFGTQYNAVAQRKINSQGATEIVSAKPIIGVSASTESGLAAAPLTYINAIKRAGGVPLVIPMTSDEAQLSVILNTVDGIVMTGGEDVCPRYFGEEPHPNLGEVVPERDAFDYKLIKMAVEKGLPVLGVCRGEQMMNIVFGGTLYQDISSQKAGTFVKHGQKAPRTYGTHSISIEKGSLLQRQLNVDSTFVNSYHHQSVKDIAPGFRVTAYSKDGIVEAIEKIGSDRVWGVQFHPEGLMSSGDNAFIGIFKHLIEKASEKK